MAWQRTVSVQRGLAMQYLDTRSTEESTNPTTVQVDDAVETVDDSDQDLGGSNDE